MSNVSELLDQLVEHFNEERWEAVRAILTEDFAQEELGTGRRLGAADSVANAQDWKTAFPDVRGTIESRVVEGNRAVGEVVWRGTHTGPLMGMPPTGKPIEVRAAVAVTEGGGKVVWVRHYLDVAGMMAQLGKALGGPG